MSVRGQDASVADPGDGDGDVDADGDGREPGRAQPELWPARARVAAGEGRDGPSPAGGGDHARAQPDRRRLDRGPLVAATVVGVAARLWLIHDRVPSWWQDSTDYLDASRADLLSLDLWAGPRTVAVPLLLKLVGGDAVRMLQVQCVVAALCWALLAHQAARCCAPRLRPGVHGLVVLFSLAAPLTMWDRSVLSESLALSSLALLAAGMVALARCPRWPSVALAVAGVAAWSLTRDTHVVVALAVPVVVAGRWALGRRRPPAGHLVVGAAALLCAVGVLAASGHGQRGDFPTRNLYEVRVLPYPERVAWFADRGMPQATLFVDGTRAPYRQEGQAPVTYVADDDMLLEPWRRWVETEGAAAYRWWLVLHPWSVVTEPLHDPERVFNNAEGDRAFYAAVDQRVVPLAGEVLLPNRPLAIAAAVGLAAWGLLSGRLRRSATALVGLAGLALALPHALVAWHADGMESARHLVVPVVQLHLAVLLLAIGALPVGEAATVRPGSWGRRKEVDRSASE